MNRRLYALHRWVSLLALVQLLAWSVSGLFFALTPEARVKGTPLGKAHLAPLAGTFADLNQLTHSAAVALGQPAERLELVGTPGGAVVLARTGKKAIRLSASTGEVLVVDEPEARQIAQRDQPGSPAVRAIARVERDAPVEYRGRPLPAWTVELSDPDQTRIYIDAHTGEVTARRNATWRTYDFLWGLHIMDYREHEDFRHPLLILAALLTVTTAVTGLVLWLVRLARRIGKRSR
jgi:Na+-transporting NADH:ubiquinone oxidoreductase subunit F